MQWLNFQLLQNNKNKKKKPTPPHKKLFQTILMLNVAQLMKPFSKRAENDMRRGKHAAYFSSIVFKGLLFLLS